jgi:hypothetical protein
MLALTRQYSVLPRPAPKPRPVPRPRPRGLPRGRKVTIAIHMQAGEFTLLTATDTQETYSSGEKIDAGKIIGASRIDPPGAINVAGSGDSLYAEALSQEIIQTFQNSGGTLAGC